MGSVRITLLATAVLLALGSTASCRSAIRPGAAGADATAMGSWPAWRDLSPLVEVAESHATKPTVEVLQAASELLRADKPSSADAKLAQLADSRDRHWISVARANVAAFNFTLCIRGVAWRLADDTTPSATDRAADFSEDTKIKPSDLSVEAMLVNLDAAVASPIAALSTQARIARARVSAFVQRCAPNEEVAQLAQQTTEADLATLAAEGHLPPDLAYMWAGVQMTRFSGTAARPFLLQAKEGGFAHPAVTLMLAVIAFENRELAHADKLAQQASREYLELGDAFNQAEAEFWRGEIARTRSDDKTALKHYKQARKLSGRHLPSMLASAGVTLRAKGEDAATAALHGMLAPLWKGEAPLDEPGARALAERLEELVMTVTEPAMVQLTRQALLLDLSDALDPARRGIRYFFAATLDVRLRNYQLAHGRAALAKLEFEELSFAPPVDVQKFLDELDTALQ